MSEDLNKENTEVSLEERIEQAKQELAAEFETAKQAMVNELQAERLKRQEVEEELKKKESPNPITDPEKLVEEILNKKEVEQAQANRKEALEEFKRSMPEFAPDKDLAGLAFRKFEETLRRFNSDGLKAKEDFKQLYADAYELMTRRTSDNKVPYYKGTPQVNPDPKEGDEMLSEDDKRLMKELGWDKQRYLKQKLSKPAFIASLLSRRQ